LTKYGRSYASKDDFNMRFETFSKNFDMVESHNSQDKSFKMAINQFSDLSEEEFNTHFTSGLKMPLRE
jgi:hypothetical protein